MLIKWHWNAITSTSLSLSPADSSSFISLTQFSGFWFVLSVKLKSQIHFWFSAEGQTSRLHIHRNSSQFYTHWDNIAIASNIIIIIITTTKRANIPRNVNTTEFVKYLVSFPLYLRDLRLVQCKRCKMLFLLLLFLHQFSIPLRIYC